MSRAPFVMGKADSPFSRKAEMFDTTMGWRFINDKLSALYHPHTMGETAENVAERWNVSREEQDKFAYDTQEKYSAAHAAGKFKEEIAPFTVDMGKGKTMVFDTDEHPRQSPLEKLAELKPAFKKGGSVTAGNSSGINDGAAAMISASEEAVQKYGLKPIAKVKAMAIAGVDPSVMGIGPVPATQKAVKRAGLEMGDIDLFEINEAFASQSIASIRELGIDASKVNVNGGAIALGHPLGCSGTRISTTLLYEMRRRNARYGVATMCIGVGQGAAIVYELV